MQIQFLISEKQRRELEAFKQTLPTLKGVVIKYFRSRGQSK